MKSKQVDVLIKKNVPLHPNTSRVGALAWAQSSIFRAKLIYRLLV